MDVGDLIHLVTLENPGPAVPDGDGGYTQTWQTLSPPMMWSSIKQASSRDLERTVSSTVLSTATHIVKMRYHPEVTTQTRLTTPDGAYLNVVSVDDVERRHVELILACVEVVQ